MLRILLYFFVPGFEAQSHNENIIGMICDQLLVLMIVWQVNCVLHVCEMRVSSPERVQQIFKINQ